MLEHQNYLFYFKEVADLLGVAVLAIALLLVFLCRVLVVRTGAEDEIELLLDLKPVEPWRLECMVVCFLGSGIDFDLFDLEHVVDVLAIAYAFLHEVNSDPAQELDFLQQFLQELK